MNTAAKCPGCPVVGPDCLGLVNRRYCTLAETRDDYRRILREHAGELPRRPMPTRSQVARVNCCPYRECATGCQMSRCHAGRSPRADGGVSLYDCIACLVGPKD